MPGQRTVRTFACYGTVLMCSEEVRTPPEAGAACPERGRCESGSMTPLLVPAAWRARVPLHLRHRLPFWTSHAWPVHIRFRA